MALSGPESGELSRPSAGQRQEILERLFHRNAIRRSLRLRPLDIPKLYFQNVVALANLTRKEPFLTKKLIQTQADLEPTDSERQKIWADVAAKNAERSANGLRERDVALMVELSLTRHRAQKYQNVLGPYLETCLLDIQSPGGHGPMPADYRDAVAKAEKQLEAATGIVSPKSMMGSEVADLMRHRVDAQRLATPIKT